MILIICIYFKVEKSRFMSYQTNCDYFKNKCPSVTRILPSFHLGRLTTAWFDAPN